MPILIAPSGDDFWGYLLNDGLYCNDSCKPS